MSRALSRILRKGTARSSDCAPGSLIKCPVCEIARRFMTSPLATNNPQLDGETLLARLKAELERPLEQTPPASLAVAQASPPITAQQEPGQSPSSLRLRLAQSRLGALALWGKSLLRLQSTRSAARRSEHAIEELRQDANIIRLELRSLRQETTALTRRKDLLAAEIAFQQARLSRALAQQQPSKQEGAPTLQLPPVPDDLDPLYLQFENEFRGSRQEIKRRVQQHLEKVRLTGAGAPDKPVLDLGCGRGEWLEALREQGLAARGIDLNSCNIDLCRRIGLDVELADALTALRNCPDGSLGGVTAFHLVEHLPLKVSRTDSI